VIFVILIKRVSSLLQMARLNLSKKIVDVAVIP
jgi:hypothetical protein